jgi:hypothetical protein
MRIVIDIEQPAAAPVAVTPPEASETVVVRALSAAPVDEAASGTTPAVMGAMMDLGLSAGKAAGAEPSASEAPPELLARATSLNALNAGPAPDLSAETHHRDGASVQDSLVDAAADAEICGLEAAQAGGITNAGAARLS